MPKTYHQLTVRNPDGREGDKLILTFVNRQLAAEVDLELFGRGYEVERSFGYQLYDGKKGREMAMESVRVFLKEPAKPRFRRYEKTDASA